MTIKIPKYDDITVLVIGDIMLDKYWQGSTNRISPEAPVPVVHIHGSEERPGGAGNVALNLKSLGCNVILLGLVGDDHNGSILKSSLEKYGIDCYFEHVEARPTITKLRVMGQHQQLIRLDFEKDFKDIPKDKLTEKFQEFLPQADAIIFSDYGKGTLTNIKAMIASAHQRNKLILIDPKNQDFTTYQNATIITPNLKEFQQVVGACNSETELVSKAEALIKQHNLKALLVTRGDEGMSLIMSNHEPLHLRAHASEVYDVSGAGDTVISVLAASLATGSSFETASILSNIAAGVVVRKLGVATVSVPELRRAVQRYYGGNLGVLQEDDLLIAIEDAKAHGEKIIMTNGCFDLLHPGHISYLEEAKSLGDRLIVAVNDDSSVQRLKGHTRPINCLQDRMLMLSALRCVDWVVPFSEDTPERLIAKISPDILVKASDYQISDIAGSNHVLAKGGEVKLIDFVAGYSTTTLVERLREN